MKQDFIIKKIDRIIMVGKEEYAQALHSFDTLLQQNELIFHFSGQATVFFDHSVIKTQANTVRFLPKGQASRYDVSVQKPGDCIDVFFETDRPVADSAFVWDASKNERVRALFQKIFVRWTEKKEGYYFKCIALLYEILAEMQKKNRTPPSHQSKIRPAVDAVLNGFLREEFSIGALAALCDVSESYFKRLFKEEYGTSPKKYVIQLKINHACDLLRLGRYTVTQVAEMCNFTSVYFFSRQFKEYMDVTPTQFIKKYKSSK